MFSYDERGIKLTGSDLWLDAERKVEFSYISHAHADHIRNHKKILATPATARLFDLRAKKAEKIILDFLQPHEMDDFKIQLYPAGHILGSSMIYVEKDSQRLLYTGDFKMQQSWTAEKIHIPQTDILIMETTFGQPEYRFNNEREHLVDQLTHFVDDSFRWGNTPVILAYALGKAQEAMKILGDLDYKIKVFKTAWEIGLVYREFGVNFKNCRLWEHNNLDENEVLIIPPHVRRYKAIVKIPRVRTVLLSGWAKRKMPYFRYGADEAIALSDHADYDELLEFVQITNPRKVYCTHGMFEFPKYLRKLGVNAEPLRPESQISLF